MKQEQGKHYLSEQLWAWLEKVQPSKRKAFLEKDVHSKQKEGTSGKLKGRSGK